jgi:hypothetical protein
VAAVALALFPAALRGFTLAGGDIQLMFLGQNDTFVHCLARGAWPVWDPFLGFGQPLLANPGNQVLYPPTWLNLLFLPETCLTLYVLGHLVWAGLGTYALARLDLGLSRWAAWLAAAAWMASGPLLSHAQRWQHFASVAWLPWVVLAATACVRRPGWWRALALAIALALQWLAGSVEVAGATLPLALAWTVARLWRGQGRTTRRAGAWLPAAGLIAVAMTAAMWVPAIDFVRASARTQVAAPQVMWWSIHPLRWVEVLMPLRPDEMLLLDELRARLFGEVRTTIVPSLYLGATLGGLVAFALWASPRRRTAAGLVLLAAGAAALAMGPHLGVLPWLAGRLPSPSIVRFPGKMTLFVSFAWALLAGLGLDAWRERLPREPGGGRSLAFWLLGAAAPAAVFAGVVLLAPSVLAGRVVPVPPPGARVFDAVWLEVLMCAAAVGAATIAAVLAWLPAARPRWRSAAVAGLAVVAVADPALPNHRVNPMVPAALVGTPPETAQVLWRLGARRIHAIENERPVGPVGAGVGRWDLDPRVTLPQTEALALGTNLALFGRSASRWGLEGSYTLESLVVPTQPQLVLSTVFYRLYGQPGMVRLLQAGAVSHVVGRTLTLEGLAPVGDIRSPLLAPIRLFAVPDPLPRTYVVGGAVVSSDDEALRWLLDPRIDLRQQVILDSGPARASPPGFQGTSRMVQSAPDDVALEVDVSDPGYVVLLDGYERSWRATVDGGPAAVHRANFGFRAVAVPAGHHTVRLLYRPRAVSLGLAISAMSLAAVLLVSAGRAAHGAVRRHARTE